ncbi:uncharacterized protein LOC131478605 [Ochotona princeps]|uniref:uncharacterized protein LOC131478605 n=1 Tax=Ochotona princeps TaxID=9978 RepID=UPI0027145077|nr:uncharacterized protein LOC131478605 [Ochotona princeps]
MTNWLFSWVLHSSGRHKLTVADLIQLWFPELEKRLCDLEQRRFIIRFIKLRRGSFSERQQKHSVTRKYCFILNWVPPKKAADHPAARRFRCPQWLSSQCRSCLW